MIALTLVATLGGPAAFTPSFTTQAAGISEQSSLQDRAEPPQHSTETYRGSFLDTSVEAVLRSNGTVLYPEDRVIGTFPDPSLGIGSLVTVQRASTVTIVDAGQSFTVRTWAPTVSELLHEQRRDLMGSDQVSPLANTFVSSGETVTVTRVSEVDMVIRQTIPIVTTYQDDPSQDKGTTQVAEQGSTGVLAQTFHVVRKNGVEVSRTPIAQKVEKPAITRKIVRGTRPKLLDKGAASFYQGVGAMTAASTTIPRGTQVVVTNESNGKSILVTIADYGPFVKGRVIDLSADAFAKLASLSSGVIHSVRVEKYYQPPS